MDESEVTVGQTFVDDAGLEFTVYQVHRSRDLVVLDGEHGRFEMSLEGLALAVDEGEFEEVTGGVGDDDSDDEQEED